MKEPRKLAPLIVQTFTFIGVVFIMFSLSFYFVYGNEKMPSVVFYVFPVDSNMFLLAIVFCCVLIIFVPLYNISNAELLERYQVIKKFVSLEDGDYNRTNLVILRLGCFLAFSLLAFITDEVTVVLNLAGGIAIPLISFYLPVILVMMILVLFELLVSKTVEEEAKSTDRDPRCHLDDSRVCNSNSYPSIYHPVSTTWTC